MRSARWNPAGSGRSAGREEPLVCMERETRYVGLLAGALILNSLDLLTTWDLYSRIGGQELNVILSAILSEYGFVALAVYKGWAMSGLMVILYLISTRDWRGRSLALLLLTSVTMLFLVAVVWNGMQILFTRGLLS
jgi:hypothetical protein